MKNNEDLNKLSNYPNNNISDCSRKCKKSNDNASENRNESYNNADDNKSDNSKKEIDEYTYYGYDNDDMDEEFLLKSSDDFIQDEIYCAKYKAKQYFPWILIGILLLLLFEKIRQLQLTNNNSVFHEGEMLARMEVLKQEHKSLKTLHNKLNNNKIKTETYTNDNLKNAKNQKLNVENNFFCNCKEKTNENNGHINLPWLNPHNDRIINSIDKEPFKIVTREKFSRKFWNMKKRVEETPYLVEFENCHDRPCPKIWTEAFQNRKDIIWLKHDLGNHVQHVDGSILDGITTPPERFYRGHPWNISKTASKTIIFQGRCSTNGSYGGPPIRSMIRALIANSKQPFPENIFFYCINKHSRHSSKNLQNFDNLMGNTDFSLVPHGDMRWSFRFIESIGACTIPVILADGLTLPYEQLVDWSEVVIRLPEAKFKNMTDIRDILDFLPKNRDWIMKTRLKICQINDNFFRNGAARDNSFWISARDWIRTRKAGKVFSQVNENCVEPLRMCSETYLPPSKLNKTII